MISTRNNSESIPFPKLMANEHVIALFSTPTKAVVVHGMHDRAVSVGKELSKACFDVENFTDYNGTIELSND